MKIKDPTEQKKIFVLNISLIGIFAVFILGGYWFGGVDFAKGTLVGCVVVAVNFFISQQLGKKLIEEGSVKPALLIAYFLKLGVTVLIMFVAINRFQVNTWGIMFGLSSILISSVFTIFVKKQKTELDA